MTDNAPAAAAAQVGQPSRRGRRVCIVTSELAGPFYNGGIGTTNRAMAMVLRDLGYEVDILYTQVGQGSPLCLRGRFEQHVETFRALGIALTCIDHPGAWGDWRARSRLALLHLRQNRYDIAFFDDLEGAAYYPLLARRTGCAALRETVICVTAHSATEWIKHQNLTPVRSLDEVRLMEMERRSLELADAVRAPSAYILETYRSYGWAIADDAEVMPNFVSEAPPASPAAPAGSVREIVFFGRLERRKGLFMFMRALDRLKYRLGGITVSFLGKATDETFEALVSHSARWPFEMRVLGGFDQTQAIDFLKAPGRLAVMASPEDNSPSTFLECALNAIPFIACAGSGGEELLDEATRRANLFEPTVDALCAKLLEALEGGAAPGRLSFEPEALRDRFSRWLDRALAGRPAAPAPRPETPPPASTLLLTVPAGVPSQRAAVEIFRAIDAFGGDLAVEALCHDPAHLRGALSRDPRHDAITVSSPGDFATVARRIAAGPERVVCVCHVLQIPPVDWFVRARDCFSAGALCAVTGMTGEPAPADTRIVAAHFSVARETHVMTDYPIGCAPAMFALAPDTNGGFALLRSGALAACAAHSPLDERYDAPKRMRDWIHEMLVSLHHSGERFELIPDMVLGASVRETDFEAFLPETFMRAAAAQAPGGEGGAILARMAIDGGLAAGRGQAQARALQQASERMAFDVHKLPHGSSWEDQVRQLASVAHASGQTGLAVDLSASLGFQRSRRLPTIDAYLEAAAAGEMIDLVEALAERYQASDLEAVKLLGAFDARRIDMHATSAQKGATWLRRTGIDLSNVTRFSAIIDARESNAAAVRFRVEISAGDNLEYWSVEKTLAGKTDAVWAFTMPARLRGVCTIRFGVEIATATDKGEYVIARWINPHFLNDAEGTVP